MWLVSSLWIGHFSEISISLVFSSGVKVPVRWTFLERTDSFPSEMVFTSTWTSSRAMFLRLAYIFTVMAVQAASAVSRISCGFIPSSWPPFVMLVSERTE